MSAKEAILELVRGMPDDATPADIAAAIDDKFAPPDADDGEWDEEMTAEINRRVEEIRSGRAKMIPSDEVFRELREKFG